MVWLAQDQRADNRDSIRKNLPWFSSTKSLEEGKKHTYTTASVGPTEKNHFPCDLRYISEDEWLTLDE